MEVPSGREWLFSVRTFAAGMTALWVVLWLNLDRPYWALASAYIASQSFAGATRSKAAFRAMGTVIGGLAALVMVPALVDAPPLLSLVLALWVGTCLFFALLDRTPRSYVFMLGGYTAAIIGFPSVDAPGAIFDTVLARVEEILIGIGTAALFGSVLFPRPIGPAVGQLVTRWLATADQWAGEVFAGRTGETGHLEYRRHLASGIVEVDALAGSLAWDPGTGWLEARSMRVLRQDMLLLLLMLASVEDRVEALGADGRAEAEGVLRAAEAWVADGAPSGASSGDGEVAEGAAALKAGTAGRTDWPGLLLGSFADRMGDFAGLRAECGALRREVAGLERPRLRPPPPGRLHRDPGMALLSAGAAVAAVLLACWFWIASAWTEGAVGAEMAAVACSFFATQDNPVPMILQFLGWSVVGLVVDAVLLFGVLPQASSFEMLALGMAPALLVFGLLMSRPSTASAGAALGANATTLLGIQSAYSADFASFVNSGLAFLAGLAGAAVVTAVVRAVGAAWSVRRLQRANWATLAAAARGYGDGSREEVAALLLDRVAQMAVRMSAVEPGNPVLQLRPLTEIRIGLNVIELRRGRRGLPEEARDAVEALLDGLAGHFAALRAGRAAGPGPDLLAALDRATGAVGRLPQGPARRDAMQGLVGVRRGLCPDQVPAPALLAA